MTTLSPQGCIACDLLRRSRTIAVVGLSPKPDRPSHEVAAYLQAQGYRILPVNPRAAGSEILGAPVHADLAALAAAGERPGIVDVFRRSEEAGQVVDEALAALAGQGLLGIWMQIGVVDDAAKARAEAAGLAVIMDRCPKIEHARLLSEGNCPGLPHAPA